MKEGMNQVNRVLSIDSLRRDYVNRGNSEFSFKNQSKRSFYVFRRQLRYNAQKREPAHAGV